MVKGDLDGLCTIQEISNSFHVDFHITDANGVLHIRWTLEDTGKYLFDNPRYHTLEILIVNIRSLPPKYTKSACPRTVGKSSTIIVKVFPLPVCPYANTVPL